jgi:predicted aspartyl protease
MIENELLDTKAKRGPRQYEYDPWKTIAQLNANITVGELAQLAPIVRTSLQQGLRSTKPTYGIVNAIELTAKTPAYALGKIGGRTVRIIVDTGAGICLMSKKLLDKLGWTIQKSSDMALVVADG